MEDIKVEEYQGITFYVSYVGQIPPYGEWFRVYMKNGTLHNFTVGYAESIEKAKDNVVKCMIDYINSIQKSNKRSII
jgi:hypothetical protein